MSPRTPTFAQLLGSSATKRLEEVHTAIPAEVVKYDASKQTVDVKPLVRVPVEQEDGSINFEEPQVINARPLVFPGAGGFRLTFPVQQGDTVLLIFAERHIDRWQALGGTQDPPLRRRFHLADAIAIPGLHANVDAWTGASSSDATMGADGGPQIVFKTAEVHLGASSSQVATEPVLLGQQAVSDLTTAISTLQGAVAGLTAAFTAAATAATGASATVPTGAVQFTALGTALTTVVTQLGSVTSALSTLSSKLAGWLSQIVKTR